ncbi:MAG: FAD-binding oxidoreductase [Chloroflexi bacterium]|nr:FAD-binding oxidoreductase [Chloroflexota bacterium]
MSDFPQTADVVVIGGGLHGTSCAYHLAKKGAGKVVLVEKKFLASGPTGRSTACIHRAHVTEYLTNSMNWGADVYRNWKDVIGGDCGYRETGWTSFTTEENREAFEANVRLAQSRGVEIRLVSPSDLKEIVPQMNVEDIAVGSYQPKAGFADPAQTTNAYANRAKELGAQIIQWTQVTAIKTAGGRVTGVSTTKGDVDAPVVLLAGGLWANQLLRPLGVEVPINAQRHQMVIFRRPPDLPTHPDLYDQVLGTYSRCDHGDLTIYGFFRHEDPVGPENYEKFNEGADYDVIARNTELIAHRLPVMEHGLSRGGYAALYDITPDHSPALGPVPGYEGLHVDFGWSGGGFKNSPMTGHTISERILTGRFAEGLDASMFSVTRFQEGKLLDFGGGTARRAAYHPGIH